MDREDTKFGRQQGIAAFAFGAVGGAAPSLLDLAARAQVDQMPAGGYYVALAIFAFLGGTIALAYKELVTHKAFLLGIGTPALIVAGGTVVNAGVAPIADEVARLEGHSWSIGIVSVAHAQDAPAEDSITEEPGEPVVEAPPPVLAEQKSFWSGFYEAIGLENLAKERESPAPPGGPSAPPGP